jgi:small subunit ribosomal protein S21
MPRVQVRDDESVEKALKRFKKACDNEGVLSHLKRASFYEKPSDKRRREAKERMKNIRKMMQRDR